jgi:hypothetical protein
MYFDAYTNFCKFLTWKIYRKEGNSDGPESAQSLGGAAWPNGQIARGRPELAARHARGHGFVTVPRA